MNNRDIVFVIKMRNEARAALQQIANDLGVTGTSARTATRDISGQARAVDGLAQAVRRHATAAKEAANLAKSSPFFADTKSGSTKLIGVTRALKDMANVSGEARMGVSSLLRESRALFDELSSGRARMMPGTLALLATRGLGIPIGSLAAGVGLAIPPAALIAGTGYAAYSLDAGQRRSAMLAASQGNRGLYGTTNEITSDLASSGNYSLQHAREVANAAAGPGLDIESIKGIAGVARDFAAVTGTSAPEAAAKLAKSFRDPIEAAKSLTDEFGLLSAAEIEQVRHLTNLGDVASARGLILTELKDRLKGLADEGLTPAARAWEHFTAAIMSGLDALARTVKPSLETLDEQIRRLQEGIGEGSTTPRQEAVRTAKRNQLKPLLAERDARDAAAKARQNAAQQQRDIQWASDTLKTYDTERERQDLRDQALKAIKAAAPGSTDLANRSLAAAATLQSPVEKSQQELLDIQEASRAPWYGRSRVTAALAAKRGVAGTLNATNADQLADIAGQRVTAQATSDVSAQISKSKELASATASLADAFGTGGAAAQRAEAFLSAYGDAAARAAGMVKQLTAATLDQKSAEAVKSAATTAAGSGLQASDAASIAAAAEYSHGSPGAIADARLQAQARANYQHDIDAATADAVHPERLAKVQASEGSYLSDLRSKASQDRFTSLQEALHRYGDRGGDVQEQIAALMAGGSKTDRNIAVRNAQLGPEVRQHLAGLGYQQGTPDYDDAFSKMMKAATAAAQYEDRLDHVKATQQELSQISGQFASTATSAIEGLINKTETWRQGLYNVALVIERTMLNAFVQEPLQQGVNSLLNSGYRALGGSAASNIGSSVWGTIGSGLSWFGSGIASLFHEGGLVSDAAAATRMVDPSIFATARRYATGGIAGLAPDEVPAVLHRGEEVLTAADPRHRDNGGGTTVNNFAPSTTVHVAGGSSGSPAQDRMFAAQIGAQIDAHVEKRMQEFVNKNQRSGGMFYSAFGQNPGGS